MKLHLMGGFAPRGHQVMIAPALNDVRVGVVLRLQSIERKFDPGTEPFETAHHAVTLALSADRLADDGEALFYRSWRDAKRILRRRRRQVLDPFSPDSELGRSVAHGGVRSMVGQESASAATIARDLERRVRQAIIPLGPMACDCFAGMLAGEMVAETAARLRITPRTVKGLRARIRAAARPLFWAEAA